MGVFGALKKHYRKVAIAGIVASLPWLGYMGLVAAFFSPMAFGGQGLFGVQHDFDPVKATALVAACACGLAFSPAGAGVLLLADRPAISAAAFALNAATVVLAPSDIGDMGLPVAIYLSVLGAVVLLGLAASLARAGIISETSQKGRAAVLCALALAAVLAISMPLARFASQQALDRQPSSIDYEVTADDFLDQHGQRPDPEPVIVTGKD